MSIRIQADNISFSYSQDRAIPVFRNVSFSVRSGEVFCLLGPNGTGKSTLLKCLDGVLRIQHGRITVGGRTCSTIACPKSRVR